MEKDFFIRLIEGSKKITDSVLDQQRKLEDSGFNNTIEISENAANLFYYDELTKSRILLEYQPETDLFVGKSGDVQFTFNEMLQGSRGKASDQLSNNVVTRPIMQEWLFPTLAFIAGPGEIAYWSELKQAFEHFELKMPPIVPRLNITLLERSVETDLQELNLELERCFT